MKLQSLIAGTLAVAVVAGSAVAANDPAFIITRSDLRSHKPFELRHVPDKGFVQIGYPQRNAVGLIHRDVLVPAATVSKSVSETPALPHLARVKLGSTTILVDPEVDYLAEEPGGIDESHSIVRAQRVWKALNAGRAHVVRRTPAVASQQQAVDTGAPQPRAILLKPDILDGKPVPTPDNMPLIPRPKKDDKTTKQVAAAD